MPWDNVQKYYTAGQATDDNIIWHMRYAFWITKATNTHSKYAILIALLRQKWLHERATMIHCMYTACLVMYLLLYISERKAIISLHSLKWLVFVSEANCVYYAVRNERLNRLRLISVLKEVKLFTFKFEFIFLTGMLLLSIRVTELIIHQSINQPINFNTIMIWYTHTSLMSASVPV